MSTLGTFDSFTTSRLGIYAAQHGLRVTGNNISNINTNGYTRQRIDQVSFKTGKSDRYASMLDNHVGSGALVTGINQIRDPFLDIRYRNTSSDTAFYDTKLSGLQKIADVLDEVGKGDEEDGLLYRELQDLATKLRGYSADPNSDNETLVRGAAEAIVSMFNKYATDLEQLRVDSVKDFNDSVTAVNKILTNIQGLNKSIRECEIHGDNALEMRDERNRQIDELSEYMAIKVEYSYEDVGAGIQVEKLTIKLNDKNPDPAVYTDSSTLVDGLYATQLEVPEKRPLMNPFISGPNQALKDYLFVKEVPANTSGSVGLEITDENGIPRTIFVVGTNDPVLSKDDTNKVVLEPNDNYTIQLGKLLDTTGREWKKEITTWDKVGSSGSQAKFSYSIKSDGKWQAGDKITIGDTTYTAVDGTADSANNEVSRDKLNNSQDLAAFIAGKLNVVGYDVRSSGTNIIYTANDAGKADKEPELHLAYASTATPGNDAATSSIYTDVTVGHVTRGGVQTINSGEDADVPQDTTSSYRLDPLTGTEFSVIYQQVGSDWYKITVTTEHTREIALDDNDLHGSLQAQREFLTEEGEFASEKDRLIDEQALAKRGIRYYQQAFDLLAQTFAEQYNQLNKGYAVDQEGYYINKRGERILYYDNTPISKYDGPTDQQSRWLINDGYYLKNQNGDPLLDENGRKMPDVNAWLADAAKNNPYNGPWFEGGVLFSNRGDGDDTTGITAANISISNSWGHKEISLVPKFEHLFREDGVELPHTTKNINADHMVSMIDKAVRYDPSNLYGSDAIGPKLFEDCSFNDMFSNMMATEANDERVTKVKLDTSYTSLVDLDSQREGVSGVDLNDEAMNMVQYQKAMNAAMRLMTAIDEALERLINNTGIAGR